MNRVACREASQLVCRSDGLASFHPAAGQPHGERVDIVVPPDRGIIGPLARRRCDRTRPPTRPAFRPAVHAQRGPLPRRRRLISLPTLIRQATGQMRMVVPIAMKQLYEPHAALHESACQQAIPANDGCAASAMPYIASVAALSPPRSSSSGALACMRKAISYAAIRAAISGSPVTSNRLELSALMAAISAAAAPARCRRARSNRESVRRPIAAAPLETPTAKNRCRNSRSSIAAACPTTTR